MYFRALDNVVRSMESVDIKVPHRTDDLMRYMTIILTAT